MKTIRNGLIAALVLLMLGASAARASDIDIYGAPTGGPLPNIIIAVDNAGRDNSNTSPTCPYAGAGTIITTTISGVIQCALYGAVQGMTSSQNANLIGKFNLGLVIYGSGSFQGGHWVIPAIADGAVNSPTPLVTMDNNGIATFLSAIASPVPTSNSPSVASLMQESWAFFTGSSKAGTEVTSGAHTTYVSHESLSCQKSYIIFIGGATKNGTPGTSNTGNVGGASGLANAGATAAQQVPINTSSLGSHTGDDASWGDEWARFLYGSDFSSTLDGTQNVVTYTIAAEASSAGANLDYQQFLKSVANQGGGKAFVATDIATIAQQILTIFNEVQAVNSVFASSSLPISANTQGTYQNQVFIGMFRPDGQGNPRWMGNLKQYQFGVDTTNPASPTLFLADSTGADAISSTTGFISPNAISFWNPPIDTSKLPDSIGGFWVNHPQSVGGGYDRPDGEIVEKGGVGQQIRLANLLDNYATNPTGPRNVYTCTGACTAGSSLSATPFATSNPALTAAVLGITNPTYTSNVSSIARSGSTATLTIAGSGASPAITSPTTITLTGSTGGQFDGSFASAAPSVSPAPPSPSTSVSWVVTENPVANPTGTYTATGTGAPTTSITNVARTTNAGLNTATVTVSDITFGTGIALTVGASVSITGVTDSNSSPSTSNPYNGSKVVTAVDTVNKTFSYQFMGQPAIPAGNGGGGSPATFCIGTKCNGSKITGTIDVATATLPGLVRGNGQVLMVNFPASAPLSNQTAVATGNAVSITGNVVDASANPASAYAQANIGTVTATGSACSVSYVNASGLTVTYTGVDQANTTSGGKTYHNYTTICVNIASGVIKVQPALTAQTQTSATAALASSTFSSTISSMSRGASSCPTSNLATVTVTTSAPYLFTNGSTVTIAGTNQGPNEGLYNSSFKIATVDSTHFTFPVPTSPACTDSASGMKITYQSSAGGINVADLINWVRGDDNVGDEPSPDPGVITIRPSVHGDVLHSRPAVVNYGGSTGVVVFYGANDGTFRAINGNQPGGPTIGTATPGQEIWSYVAPEFFTKLQRLYQNSPSVLLATTPASFGATPKDYFFDGSTGIYQGGGKVYIFLSARRGGRFIEALDVTDPTNPKLMWKKSNTDTGMGELGYTWSTPKPALVRGYANPVLIFGAGYDPLAEDAEPPTADGMGRGIFILDATTGTIVWSATFGAGPGGICTGSSCTLSDMQYAIPADITLVNRDFDKGGYIDRLYATDLGGNIWRVDLEPAGYCALGALDASGNPTGASNLVGPTTWTITKFAALGGASTDPTKRKFFYSPDIVPVGAPVGTALCPVPAGGVTATFDMVLDGTGDREHPLYGNATQSYGIVNRFYGLKDPNTGSSVQAGWTSSANTIVDNTSDTTDTAVGATILTTVTATSSYDPTTPNNGFYMTFPNAGEKAVNAPTTIGGLTYIGTNTPQVPTAQACGTLGIARGYQINFLTGQSAFTTFTTGGLPPSPVAGLVDVTFTENGQTMTRPIPFCLGCGSPGSNTPDSTSTIGGIKPKISVPPVRKRVYWYLQNHDN